MEHDPNCNAGIHWRFVCSKAETQGECMNQEETQGNGLLAQCDCETVLEIQLEQDTGVVEKTN